MLPCHVVDSFNDVTRHWDFGPHVSGDAGAGGEIKEEMASLLVAVWSKANCPQRSLPHGVVMFFMSLDVSPELEPDVHTIVPFPSCHDVPWRVLVRHAVPMREGVQPEYRVLDEVNDDYSWDTSKWQHPVCASRPVLNSLNVSFHLRDVLIGGTAVDLWEPWSEAFKFIVCHYA